MGYYYILCRASHVPKILCIGIVEQNEVAVKGVMHNI
jgi:hypothetical protein